MGLLSNKIRRDQLNPGDHIYVWRSGYSYSHHGIYVGDGKVIHVTRAPGPIIFSSASESFPYHRPSGEDRVECCSIEDFLSGGDLNLYHYGVNRALFLIKRGGTCTRFSSDPPKDVLHRAFSLLEKGFGDYNLFHSNCEDFAIYCKTGLLRVDTSKPGRSGPIKFLYAIFLTITLTPYPFLPSGFTSLALVLYGLYCGFILELDRSVDKVEVEKFDSGYLRSVRMENGRSRRYLPIGEFIAFAVWLLRYYPVGYRIGYRIRSAVVPESFDDLLTNHPMIQILGGSVAVILWLRDYCRSLGPDRGIYFWIKVGLFLGFLLLVVYDYQRGFKLIWYLSHVIMVIGLWYWTQESRIVLWKRFVDFYGFLHSFVSDLLRNDRMDLKLWEYVACITWVLGYWCWSSESRTHFWTKLVCLYTFLFFFVPDQSKLREYASQTTLVLGVWYWTPESVVLIWIRLVLLNVFLFKFFLDHLRNRKHRCMSCNPTDNPNFRIGL
ncbi:hypothetical protein FNV43_RR25077 [Rhamnella rubrinervis]|uniref:LRAT domain-containing protein n=1 Tax=Rhamnella rubrinervis TaxID=2594499 RepID=A0A8K0GPR6_9ROSA|nr:hypothetical protein FNV43_RR25077 [Rhamnella rubrinervis]